MAIQLGDIAPNFKADSTEGPIDFYEHIGSGWAVLFSHPKDFTPVCTTELGEVARLKKEFDKRGVKVLGLSVDAVKDHKAWAGDIKETQGYALNFPLLADPDRKVSDLYGMIHPNANDTLTVRSVFVIGPDKKVKLMITYPASTGRNFEEILRVIDSLQLTAKHSVATPVNWKQRPGLHHRPLRQRRGREEEVPGRLEDVEAVSAHRAAAARLIAGPARYAPAGPAGAICQRCMPPQRTATVTGSSPREAVAPASPSDGSPEGCSAICIISPSIAISDVTTRISASSFMASPLSRRRPGSALRCFRAARRRAAMWDRRTRRGP